MARIPNADDLGPRPVPRARAPRVVDQSGEIQAEAMGRAAERIGAAVTGFAERRDLFNASKAKATYIQAEAAARLELENDPDWETYETRYREKMAKVKDETLKGVKIPQNREALGLEFDGSLERGALAVRQASRAREVDSGRADLSALLTGLRSSALNLSDEPSRAAAVTAVGENILTAQANGYLTEQEAIAMRQRWTTDYAESLVGMRSWAEQIDMLKGKGIVDLIAPDRRADMLRQAENQLRIERDREEAKRNAGLVEMRQALNDQMRDITVAAQMGLPVNVPAKTVLQTAFGEREGAQRYELAVKASQLSGDVASLQQLPSEKIRERVESYRPSQAEGAADQAQLYGHIANSAERIMQQRAADPAGYLTQFAPKTQAAWAEFQRASTPEARDAYISAVNADRERLGLPRGDILPNSYAKALAEEISDPTSAESLASTLEAEAQRWGQHWPQVHAQIAKDLPDTAAVIGSGVDRSAAVTLASMAKLKESELKALLPANVKLGDLQADVASKFDDVRRAFPAEGARTWEAISGSATRLAISYMQAGESKSNAVNRAYKDLIDNQYAIGEVKSVPFLVPRQFDAGEIQDEAQRAIDEFEPSIDMVAAPPGDDPARFSERAREAIRSEAYWVARGDGQGLRMYLGSRPTSVTYTFEQLNEMAAERRAKAAEQSERRRGEAVQKRFEQTSPGLR